MLRDCAYGFCWIDHRGVQSSPSRSDSDISREEKYLQLPLDSPLLCLDIDDTALCFGSNFYHGDESWGEKTLETYDTGRLFVLLSKFVVYTFLLVFGMTIAELAFAFGPLVVGAVALLCVVFMRKSEEGGEVGDVETAS
jgi:hypothetical protein